MRSVSSLINGTGSHAVRTISTVLYGSQTSFTGYPDDPMRIDSIVINPDPPRRGENLTVTVIGEAYDTIKVCQNLALRNAYAHSEN